MNQKFLNQIYKNTKMAVQSIENMYPKFRSTKLKQFMKDAQQKYLEYMEQCKKIAQQKKLELKDASFFSKTMLKLSISMSTLFDKSSEHIAELFLMGTVRGTLSLYKELKTYKDADKDIVELAKNLKDFEEQSFEQIKIYLQEWLCLAR